jgi:hypothetical protein
MERVNRRWTVGPYEFAEIEFGRGHPWAGRTMYRYTIEGERVDPELYASLDRAMVSAVGARHMGPRGAGGNAVGTAADWFCIMIDLPEPDPDALAAPEVRIADRCLGSGQGWATREGGAGGYLARCRSCGQSPQQMGAPIPERGDGYTFLGLVPEHALA